MALLMDQNQNFQGALYIILVVLKKLFPTIDYSPYITPPAH